MGEILGKKKRRPLLRPLEHHVQYLRGILPMSLNKVYSESKSEGNLKQSKKDNGQLKILNFPLILGIWK